MGRERFLGDFERLLTGPWAGLFDDLLDVAVAVGLEGLALRVLTVRGGLSSVGLDDAFLFRTFRGLCEPVRLGVLEALRANVFFGLLGGLGTALFDDLREVVLMGLGRRPLLVTSDGSLDTLLAGLCAAVLLWLLDGLKVRPVAD